MKILLTALSLIYVGCAWSSEAIGFYSKGALNDAQSVFEKGTPIHKLFVARQRLYTTDEMHDVLTAASEFVKEEYPNSEILQVGDLSMKNGGLANGHDSHQNGLDADIVYLRRNGYVQSPDAPDWEEDFVAGSHPTENFNSERNLALLRFLVKNYPVGRIFVDTAIKKNLCLLIGKNSDYTEMLRRLRPANLHRTHFHLRLDCPVNDHKCVKQSEVPKGSGCDDLSITIDEAENSESC